MTTTPRRRAPGRRRLPARIYWTRRLMVLGVAAALVLGLSRLLGATVGGDDAAARPVGATAAPTDGASGPAAGPGGGSTRQAAAQQHRVKARRTATPSPTPTPLAEPTGPCEDSDVVVSPQVDGDVYAGDPVTFDLVLTTRDTPACTWTVSPKSVVVRLTSGSDRIWSTQDCKAAVRKEDVVVRKDVPTSVQVTWRGQRSDGSCSRTTDWAQPGYYYVTTAAIGAEPVAAQFVLREPVPETITPSPSPTAEDKGKSKGEDDEQDGKKGRPSERPSPGND